MTAERQDREGEAPTLGQGCELPLTFDIGAAVACEDQRCGKLVRVVIDPVTEQVTDLVVAHGLLQRDPRVVPVSTVKTAVRGEVTLAVTAEALSGYRAYREVAYQAPPAGSQAGRYRSEEVIYAMAPYPSLRGKSVMPARSHVLQEGLAHDQRAIGRGTHVRDAEGNAGEVDHVLVDCLRSDITHIVVRHGLLGGTYIVPVSYISRVEDKTIFLAANRAAIKALPTYDPET